MIADGFYEWQHEKKKAYPYHIRLVNRDSFAIAGVWDTWINPDNKQEIRRFSVITTVANPLLEKVHNTRKRMPVILRREDEQKWLSSETDTEQITFLLSPYDDNEMDAYTVSPLISRRGQNTNTPEVMEKYRYKGLED